MPMRRRSRRLSVRKQGPRIAAGSGRKPLRSAARVPFTAVPDFRSESRAMADPTAIPADSLPGSEMDDSAAPVVSVIIPAMNEQRTIAGVIREARKVHHSCEIIVVANGCTDQTATIAATMGARVVNVEYPLGHDVGRFVGTKAARGSILLYLDADMRIAAEQLRPFVHAIESGRADVALNRYNGSVKHRRAHPVVIAKHVLNSLLGRPELRGASMTTVPHALSRRAVDIVGAEHLSVPPLAQAMAASSNLQISAVCKVPVGRLNRKRRKASGEDLLKNIVVSDHIQAMHWYLNQTDARGWRSDLGRMRNWVKA